MGWETQVDMSQMMRQLKLKKSYYDNPSRGLWRLTKTGLEAAQNIAKE